MLQARSLAAPETTTKDYKNGKSAANGSAARLKFLGYDSVTRTADALVPRAATYGALSEREMNGCVVGSPAACAVVPLGALLVNLEAAPDEVPADAAHSPGMRHCHTLILPRFQARRMIAAPISS